MAGRGYGYADAVAYWVREGQPARMDVDWDGVPCESVYAAIDVSALIARPPTVEAWIVAWNSSLGERPEGVIRPAVIECDRRGAIRPGDVFGCSELPQLAPGFEGEGDGIAVLVLDERHRTATATGTDVPGSTDSVLRQYRLTGRGLLCRDLASEAVYPFNDGYFWAVAYWFLEGEPARMDVDGDGIPCENVFPPKDVRAVWGGA